MITCICVLLHQCVKVLFDKHSLLVTQWGLVVIAICHDYFGHDNICVGFFIYLVMLCVSLPLNN